jgi:hypothetical protein
MPLMNQGANHRLNLKASHRLALLFVAAVTITLLTANGNFAAAFFQSPVSPVEGQPPPAEEAPIPPSIEQAAPVAPPPDMPGAEQAAPPAELPASPVMPNAAPVAAPQPVPLPTLTRPNRVAPLPDNPADSSSNLIVDQAEFVDTVIVTTAYVWLCCGIILILLIPLIFLFLHIRGRSKILKEEQRF